MIAVQTKTISAWSAAMMAFRLMTKLERHKAASLAVIAVLAGLIDTVALLGVMPLVTLIIEPEVITSDSKISLLYKFIGEPSFNDFILSVAAGAVFLIILSFSLNIAVFVLIKKFRLSCQNRMARELMTMCARAPFDWIRRQNSVTLAHNVFNDVISWSNGGIQGIISIIGDIFLLLFVMAIVFKASPWPGIAVILLVGLVSFTMMKVVRPRISKLTKAHRVSKARGITFTSEFIGGLKDIKVSGRESVFVDVYEKWVNTYGNEMNSLKLLQTIPPIAMQYLSQIAVIMIALLLWVFGHSSGEIASEMALVLLVTTRAVPAITRLSREISELWSVSPSIAAIYQILDEISSHINWTSNEQAESEVVNLSNWSRISLKNISYYYSSKLPASIKNLSLEIKTGGNYGIVGPTGSGKTTLIDLILGLTTPTKGNIFIDDVELKPKFARGWQKTIGYVPQNPIIIDASLIENVALGVPWKEIDRAHAINCLEQVHLANVLKSIGLEGQLGERGNILSGGQRQLVAIARALYERPSILILDEATSALDAISERIVQEAIKSLSGQVTMITVAHRLTTVEQCNAIFILEKGELAHFGTYYTLLKDSALFRQLAFEPSGFVRA